MLASRKHVSRATLQVETGDVKAVATCHLALPCAGPKRFELSPKHYLFAVPSSPQAVQPELCLSAMREPPRDSRFESSLTGSFRYPGVLALDPYDEVAVSPVALTARGVDSQPPSLSASQLPSIPGGLEFVFALAAKVLR